MITNYSPLRKTAASLLLLFPVLMMLAFLMHFNSVNAFFNFRLTYGTYDAGKLFDALVNGRGHGFVMAHTVAFFSIPLFFIAILTFGWVLYADMPVFTTISLITGIIGCTAMAALFGAWLSFSGIATLNKSDVEGARAGFIELVKMKGMLKFFTLTSVLCFVSLAMFAAGLLWKKKFRVWPMLCIIVGASLFIIFRDLDNWMFIGAALLLVGFVPVSKMVREGDQLK